ncbi:hypothetical protein V6B14_12870 [Sporosarcina psychrophila]|uniref:hypothetical protein n=1 Tax=Sporosarcina psychrophila TaxID=1476 RepID=UPI0030D12BCC
MKSIFLNDVKTSKKVKIYETYSVYNKSSRLFRADIQDGDWELLLLKLQTVNAFPLNRNESIALADDQMKWKEHKREIEEGTVSTNVFVAVSDMNLLTFKEYKLQDAVSLYTELAKLRPFYSKDLQNFSKVFGLPMGMENIASNIINNVDMLDTRGVNLANLNDELIRFRGLFRFFTNLMTKNMDALRLNEKDVALALLEYENSKVPNNKEQPDNQPSKWGKYNNNNNEILRDNITDDELLINYKKYLIMQFENIDGVVLKMDFDSNDDSFFPKIDFVNLFQFAYYQMMKALINNVELIKCEYCGHVFELAYKGRRFCPPLPNRKRSSCEMAYNNRKKQK